MNKAELNLKQLEFCRLYVTDEYFGNGTRSYMEAYGLSESKKGDYQTAMVNASRLLSNAKILAHISTLLNNEGLNDQFVDLELLFVIKQKSDLPSKVAAIREYNKLKSRVTEKIHLKVTKLGKDLEQEKYE